MLQRVLHGFWNQSRLWSWALPNFGGLGFKVIGNAQRLYGLNGLGIEFSESLVYMYSCSLFLYSLTISSISIFYCQVGTLSHFNHITVIYLEKGT